MLPPPSSINSNKITYLLYMWNLLHWTALSVSASDQVVARYQTSPLTLQFSFPPAVILQSKHSEDVVLHEAEFLWYCCCVWVHCSCCKHRRVSRWLRSSENSSKQRSWAYHKARSVSRLAWSHHRQVQPYSCFVLFVVEDRHYLVAHLPVVDYMDLPRTSSVVEPRRFSLYHYHCFRNQVDRLG